MTKNQINELLQAQHGVNITPGYNYVIFSIRTRNPEMVAKQIRENKAAIEEILKHPLLPYVCYTRQRSVIVPIPFDMPLSTLGNALTPFLTETDAQIPSWS